ncbi:MAG: tRNA pseudouridine(55) synthase TruB [Tissierellia bacterium]|nr:tRNA pseudouridine(55) synthase TruB [Tissierellia bacterium]
MNYNGLIVVNKKKGIGSTDCVRKVKKVLNQKKVGHSGTLDFLATGVLVICLGKATRLIEYLQKQKKTYIAGMQFGAETDTLDIEGEIISTTKNIVQLEDLESKIKNFTGTITQIPPMYSALKQNGVRLYDLARAGINVERKSRNVTIYNLEIVDFDLNKQNAIIETTVSAGTYIRSLIDDLAKSVDSLAYMESLVRTESCGFNISEAIDIDNIEKEDLVKSIIPMEVALSNFDKIIVSETEKAKLLNGMTVPVNIEVIESEVLVMDIYNNILGIGNLFETTKGKMLKLKKHLYINENN